MTCNDNKLWNFRLGQITLTMFWGAEGLEEGCVKITLIVSCLEWLTCLFIFTMVEFEKELYIPDLKLVLIFLLRKSSKRVQCSNNNCLTLARDATSRNGQRQAWWPKCAATPPPRKLAAQLKSPFGDSCLKLIGTFLETPGGVI